MRLCLPGVPHEPCNPLADSIKCVDIFLKAHRNQIAMSYIRSVGIFALCFLSAACTAGAKDLSDEEKNSAVSALRAAPSLPAKTNSANMAALEIPTHFTSYASEPIGNGLLCHVGAVTGDDGMEQKPVVYAENEKNRKILWVKHPKLPPNTFQSRATHCAGSGDAAFVLLQSDTQSEQTLSQTLPRVVKLNADTGALITQQDLNVPKAYTAWVAEGADRFKWQGNSLVIAGNYRTSSDDANQAEFTVRLNSDLKP